MRRPLKYPVSALVGAACGHRSEAYKKAYALEQWATRHGYVGHRPHNVPTKAERELQQVIRFNAK